MGRRGERGGILLLALVLSITFGLLALAVLASTDTAERVHRSTGEMEGARLAAESGIEWAAAVAMANDPFRVQRTVALAPGVSVAIDADSARAPQLLATGTCQGVTVTLGADIQRRAGAPLPYAYASFAGRATSDQNVQINGSVYFANPTGPVVPTSNGRIEVNGGDAYLVSSTAVSSSLLRVTGGSIFYGITPVGHPTVDTAPYASMASGAVQVTRYSGNTTIRGQTLTGIVVVDLLVLLGSLTIEDSRIDGTLVVRSLDGDLIGSGALLGTRLTAPKVRLVGTVVINGGTATTGNLALLAPGCVLIADQSNNSRVTGVSYVWACDTLRSIAFEGQLATVTTWDTQQSFSVTRPLGFVPSTPIGITWPGPASLRIRWLGRQ